MAKRLYLDIETLPAPPEDWPAIAEIKLPDTDEVTPETNAKAYRDLALGGEFGRILCIGLTIESASGIYCKTVLGFNSETKKFHLEEPTTLRQFWQLARSINLYQDLIVGHNILDFDLPFIIKRSIIHGIRPSLSIPFTRYRSQPIFDTMWQWTQWRHRISLAEVTLALGIPSPKDELSGSQVYQAWIDGRDEEIANYCLKDVEATREIYRRLNFLDSLP